jgi:hypothetical protein
MTACMRRQQAQKHETATRPPLRDGNQADQSRDRRRSRRPPP